MNAEPIAITAMSCRFPGDVFAPEDLWRVLMDETDAITELPGSTGPLDQYVPAGISAPGTTGTRWAGRVPSAADFDAGFFGISPAEAESVDPQQRMLLEVSHEAMERAGLPARGDEARDCGVFVGISGSDYGRLLGADLARVGPYFSTGQSPAIAANRLSYAFDLRGPSLAVDTACSSGLVALDLAVQHLRRGTCGRALVGAVNLVLAPDNWVSLSEFGMMASDGRCRPFGADGDGYVRSDGCAVLVLELLTSAQRRGSEVLAVIRGTAVNQDGRSNGLTAPSGPAQEEVINRALVDAGLPSSAVTYVEAHGSGTPLGDPIEFGALLRTYGKRQPADGPCYVGSVKSNIGHTEAAAGLAGLVKLVLCLRNRKLPASLHTERLNPRLPATGGSVEIVTSTRPWDTGKELVGAVSSFGYGGTNAHAVVSEGVPAPTTTIPDHPALVLPLSARSAAALRALAGRYADTLEAGDGPSVADVCYTAAVRRAHFDHRRGFVAVDRDGLVAELRRATADNERREKRFWRESVLVFPGQGGQHAAMGRELLAQPAFRQVVDACEPIFAETLGVSVHGLLAGWNRGGAERLRNTAVAQAALFVYQAALYAVWRSFGVRPAAVIGHSAGEAAAAFAAGLFDLESAARLVAERGTAMADLRGSGGMLAVTGQSADSQDIRRAAEQAGLVLAAENSPRGCVLSGPEERLAVAAGVLTGAGYRCTRLTMDYAFHSPAMRPAADRMRAMGVGAATGSGTALFCSSVTGDVLDPAALGPDYWARGVVQPVRMRQAVEALLRRGFTSFLEIGPASAHAVDIAVTARWAGTTPVEVVHAGGDLPETLARLYSVGADLDWTAVYPHGRFVQGLPTYPWQRQRYWGLDPTPKGSEMTHPAVEDLGTWVKGELAGQLGLDVREISDDDRFLELGADSLVMLKLVARLNARYGTQIEVRQLLEEYMTIRELAGGLSGVRVLDGADAQEGETAPTTAEEIAVPTTSAPAVDVAPLDARPVDGLPAVVAEQLKLMRDQLTLLGARARISADPPASTATSASAGAKPAEGVPAGGTRTGSSAGRPPEPPKWRPSKLTPAQERFVNDLASRTSSHARQLVRRYRPRLAESRPFSHFRPELKDLHVPLVAERTAGAKIWDDSGREYIDYGMGFGVHLFGHNPPFVTSAIRRQLDRTYSLGVQLKQAYELAERLGDLTGHERVTFCNTGSEAVMGAIRLARLATGRPKVAYFDRSYHGLTDLVLARADAGGATPIAPGLSAAAASEAVVLPYGQESALEYLRAADDVAAVVVEPVQSRNPSLQPAAFLAALRRLTGERGMVLVFDEMITGFRIGPGGAAAHFGVTPDLATYGKIIGGGLPLAVIAGRGDLMGGMDGGVWRPGDGSMPTHTTTLFGGTFQKHPLAVAAATSVLDHLADSGPGLYEDLNARADRLVEGLREIFREAAVPYTVASFGSMWRLEYRGNPSLHQPLEMELLYHTLLSEGIHVQEGRTFFLSTVHEDTDAERLLDAVDASLRRLREPGFLTAAQPAPRLEWAMTPQQKQLWQLQRHHGPQWTAYHESVLVDLRGDLDRDALRRAWRDAGRNHPALRAAVTADGEWLRCDRSTDLTIRVSDVPPTPEAIADDAAAPFAPLDGSLCRATLFEHSPQHHALLVSAHHLVMDGTSLSLLLDDLAGFYSGHVAGESLPPSRPAVPVRLRQQVTSVAEPLPRTPDAFDPARRHTVPLAPDLWAALRTGAAELGCTPFALAFSAFAYALHQVTGEAELGLGVHVDQRPLDEHDFAGHYVLVAGVRTALSRGESFRDLEARTRPHLVNLLDRPAAAGEPDAVFNLNPAVPEPRMSGLDVSIDLPPVRHAKYPLFFDVISIGENRFVDIVHRPSFDAETVEKLHLCWESLIRHVGAEGSDFAEQPHSDPREG
ncbi:type I polyketide synthase [Saccharothrix coeruleofusca]|uniref:Amino acid adenylation domain-containing protein n=1 Tax=Saccharothrix coeruleofusca TaxID=33919 RepID=A0A918ANY9_9PSEU|nr:type I polyketide synthase [Saccharothrix coeruleofusca]GGP55825.1 hypothetical protein GCM10010185_30490 [Saccharothrix coeruleofusca]